MSTLFYNNPRLMILVIGLILVAGSTSYVLLPRMEDPQMVPRAANVNTRFPGADAERVETLITEKLEDALREVDDIKRLRTNSRTGISTINIELRDDVTDAPPVWSRIRDKINDVTPQLPPGASDPEFDELDIKAYALLVSLTWQSEVAASYAVLRREAKELEDVIKGITGTEKVDVFGDPEEQIYVNIDPSRAAALGLNPAQISRQIQASDSKNTAGRLVNSTSSLTVEVSEELDTLQRLGRTPIHSGQDGSFVLLSDIAELEKGALDPPASLSLVDGRPAIVLGIMSRPEVRIDHWSAEVEQKIDDFAQQLGSGLAIETVFAQNDYVEARLNGLLGNLVLGGAAVFAVVFVMMGWRSAIVVGLSLPLSALMVLSGLRWLGIPIHQMSVTGLIIALGLLIDNAIVMVDAVGQRMRRRMTAPQAIRDSLRHLAVPLLGSTLTTVFAFSPIALMPGPAGEFVGSISISVILAIVSSLMLALTIVPTLAALGWTYASRSADASGGLEVEIAQGDAEPDVAPWWHSGLRLPWLTSAFSTLLTWTLAHPWRGVAVGMVLPLLGFVAASQLREQFFPPADRDQIYLELELPMGSSIERTAAVSQQIREEMLADERIEAVHWFLGESGPAFYYNVIPRRKGTPRYGQAMVQLTSSVNAQAIIHDWQSRLNDRFPEARILVRQLEQGPPFEAPIEIRLYGQDLETLQDLGDEMREILAGIPDVVHTATELAEPQPKLSLRLDEEKVRMLGLDHSQIAEQLRGGLDGVSGGSVLEGSEEVPVSVRLQAGVREDVNEIGSLEFVALGRPVGVSDEDTFQGIPLASLGELTLVPDVATIPRYNGQRMNEVRAYVRAGVLPSKIAAEFERRLAASDFRLPTGFRREDGGEKAERNEAVRNLMANVGLLAVLMMATLVLSFKSFRMAGVILVVGALSMGLGLGSLWLFGFPFGFMAIVGTMGLIGVAINDSIVVLAALRENPRARHGDLNAMVAVVMEASRHVLSTTLTTIAGFTPLVLAGGGFWPPLAVAIAGGVGGATILALLLVPACFRLLVKFQFRDHALVPA